MAFPTGWSLLGKYTIDNTKVIGSTDITDLPVLLDTNAFKSVSVNLFSDFDNGGGDLRLTSDEAGTTQLPVHVVSFNTVTETAEVWTLITLDADADTVIYIWGDNTGQTQPSANATYGSQAVYPAIFKGVYNFQDSSNDATSNGANGTEIDGIGYVDGKIGRALNPLGYNNADRVDFATNWGLGTSSFSVLQWINLDSTSEQGIFFAVGDTNGGGVSFGVGNGTFNDCSDTGWNGNEFIVLMNAKRWFDSNTNYGTGDFQAVFQLDADGHANAYKNGEVLSNSDSGSAPNSPGNTGHIGGFRVDTYEYEVDAQISLTWVINSVVSADWIATAYNNQVNVATFGTLTGNDVVFTATVLSATFSVVAPTYSIKNHKYLTYEPILNKLLYGERGLEIEL